MDPDGSLMDGGLAPNHGSHPAAIQCWTIRIRSERAHHHQRRYHSKQSPELWYTSYHWTAKPLCNRQPVVLYKVHGDSSHPTTKRLSSNLDRSALDFFFLLYHSQHGTEDGHYIGVYRYGSVPGHSRFVGVLEYSKGHLSRH